VRLGVCGLWLAVAVTVEFPDICVKCPGTVVAGLSERGKKEMLA